MQSCSRSRSSFAIILPPICICCLLYTTYDTIAAGDSYNDLGMIQASRAGFLFKSTAQIKADHPEVPAYEGFDELLAAIRRAMD